MVLKKIKVGPFLDDWIAKKEQNNKLAPTTLNGYKVNIKHAKRVYRQYNYF